MSRFQCTQKFAVHLSLAKHCPAAGTTLGDSQNLLWNRWCVFVLVQLRSLFHISDLLDLVVKCNELERPCKQSISGNNTRRQMEPPNRLRENEMVAASVAKEAAAAGNIRRCDEMLQLLRQMKQVGVVMGPYNVWYRVYVRTNYSQ